MKLRPLVTIDGILQAVKRGEDEGRRVSGLVNLTVLHVVLENFDTALAPEHLLAVTALFANVRKDVEGEFSDVESACLSLMLDQVEQGLDQATLHKLNLEEVEERGRQESHERCLASGNVFVVLDEGSQDFMAADLVEVLRHEAHEVRYYV